jgi:hypothetical protein
MSNSIARTANVLEDLRDGDHRLAFGSDEDQVAAAIDAHGGSPHARDTAEREPPFRAVWVFVQGGVQVPVPISCVLQLPAPLLRFKNRS